jgi:hypothetical protein
MGKEDRKSDVKYQIRWSGVKNGEIGLPSDRDAIHANPE